MKKKKWLKIAVGVLVLVLAMLTLVGNYLVDYAIARKKSVNMEVVPASSVSVENISEIEQNTKMVREQRQNWLSSVSREDVQILSDDGLTLNADLFRAEQESHRWLIAIHGYTGQRSNMYDIASYYHARGYHILAPDMRGHGQSEGSFIGMGWLDRMDVLKWIDFVIAQDSEAEIVLHGISMGGATVMMTAGEELPPQVQGIVEDCGYTSVWDIFSDELAYLFHLPDFPVLYAADFVSKVRAGYGFREASALKQVAKSKVPILFVHGSEDNFVHTEMVYELYDACQAPKELLVVDGAGHGQAYTKDPDLYFETVFAFLARECQMDE